MITVNDFQVYCKPFGRHLIFWSCNIAKIDRVAMKLCRLGVTLEQEDDAAGFLGVSNYK